MVSRFNDRFFGQWLVLHTPFEQPSDFLVPEDRAERHYVAASDLPAELISLGQSRRACVLDKKQKKTRLELIHSDPTQGRLRIVSDRGTMSWQCLFWLFQRLPTVGSFQWDEPHKDWTSVNQALDASGLRPFRLCLTTLLNVASGPWQGAAMFGNISASAAKWFIFYLRGS